MPSAAVNKYIERRYDRWMDYAVYHCIQAGIENEAVDILNEVLCMLLQKDPDHLDRLLESKSGKHTELDWYVLQMIKLNITSPTSPYQHKYKAIPIDDSVDWQRLNIVDSQDDDVDPTDDLLAKYRQVREVLETLNLSEKAQRVFSWKFFEDESFSDWPGDEDKRELYLIYNKVVEMVREKINGKSLF